MNEIQWVPGAVATPNPITLPAGSPDIDDVVSAEIWRVTIALGLDNHTQAQIVAALAAHPEAAIVGALAAHVVHNHQLDLTDAQADDPATRVQSTPLPAPILGYPGGGVTVAGGAGGVLDNLVAQGHAPGATAVAHADGANPVPHGGSADPVVAAVPLKLSERTFRLNVSTQDWDILTLVYLERGVRLHV